MTVRVLRPTTVTLPDPVADTDDQLDGDAATDVPQVEPDDGFILLDGGQPVCIDDLFIEGREERR